MKLQLLCALMLVSVTAHAMERPTKKHKANSQERQSKRSLLKFKIRYALGHFKSHNQSFKQPEETFTPQEIIEQDRVYYRYIPGPDGSTMVFKYQVSYQPTMSKVMTHLLNL